MTIERLSRKFVNRRAVLGGAGAMAGMLAMPHISRAQSKEIALGALIALTGTNAAWGQRTWRGFQLACDMVNEQGGIASMGGAKLKYMVADTESKPELAPSQAERLIRDGAVALIGTNQSPASIVATQITERSQIPFISSTDADPLLTGRGLKYIFRTMPTIDRFVRDILKAIRETAEAAGGNPTKLAVLSENTITGQSSVKFAEQYASEYGFELIEAATYDASRTQNFTPYIAKYKGQGVEVLIGHNKPADAILITRTMSELGFNPKAYGGLFGGHISSEYTATLGPVANNVLVANNWAPDLAIKGLDHIAAAYQERYDERLDTTGAAGFISLSVIWSGLEAAGSADPVALRDAIANIEIPVGERMMLQPGGVKFDETGENAKASAIVMQIRDGKPVTVWPSSLANEKAVYPKPDWPA